MNARVPLATHRSTKLHIRLVWRPPSTWQQELRKHLSQAPHFVRRYHGQRQHLSCSWCHGGGLVARICEAVAVYHGTERSYHYCSITAHWCAESSQTGLLLLASLMTCRATSFARFRTLKTMNPPLQALGAMSVRAEYSQSSASFRLTSCS